MHASPASVPTVGGAVGLPVEMPAERAALRIDVTFGTQRSAPPRSRPQTIALLGREALFHPARVRPCRGSRGYMGAREQGPKGSQRSAGRRSVHPRAR